ncbi:MAG: hypothetical protein R3F47_15580 [Gammaproteobacteria bacterium]|jgi:hypothetical protein|tara:strand:- start:1946 stop:2149 length:204 start_codon:yes stop_codon:yes gene_type:complete
MDMFDLLKYQTVVIPCPHWGNAQVKTLGWLNENQHLHCICGTSFPVNLQMYAKEVKALERRFQDYLG